MIEIIKPLVDAVVGILYVIGGILILSFVYGFITHLFAPKNPMHRRRRQRNVDSNEALPVVMVYNINGMFMAWEFDRKFKTRGVFVAQNTDATAFAREVGREITKRYNNFDNMFVVNMGEKLNDDPKIMGKINAELLAVESSRRARS